MALEPPGSDELDEFSHGSLAALFTEDQMDMALQQATDLLWLSTRVDEMPDDETVERIVNWGIMDMAWSLLVHTENKTEINSPYSSERIGSYSYSKALDQVRRGNPTGVPWFDAAVGLLTEGNSDYAAIWSTTETVFTSPYSTDLCIPLSHDPALFGTTGWVDGGWVDP